MLQHVIDCSKAIGATDLCVVYGFGGESVMARIDDEGAISWQRCLGGQYNEVAASLINAAKNGNTDTDPHGRGI